MNTLYIVLILLVVIFSFFVVDEIIKDHDCMNNYQYMIPYDGPPPLFFFFDLVKINS